MPANGARTPEVREPETNPKAAQEPEPVVVATTEVVEEATLESMETIEEPETVEVVDVQIETAGEDIEQTIEDETEAEEEQEPSANAIVLDTLGYMLHCCNPECKKVLETVGEVRIPVGQAPDGRFKRGMYKTHCAEHVEPIEKALELSGNGRVVGLFEARQSARNFFRKLVEHGIHKQGCVRCGHMDAGEDAPYWQRNKVITCLAPTLAHDKSLEVLIGGELCEYHGRSADRIDMPLRKYDDYHRRQRVNEAMSQEKEEEYKRKMEALVTEYLGPNAIKQNGGRQKQNTR